MGCGAGHGVSRNRLHATGGVVGTKKLKLASRVERSDLRGLRPPRSVVGKKRLS
jgi:hypothetical protein